MHTVLSVAGSDSGGGAGIQADLKTMTMLGVYGMTAITAVTAQNTLGVTGIEPISAEFLAMQMDAVFQDIPPEAVKIGMVYSEELAAVIAEKLVFYDARNVVVDPVMVATSGAALAQNGRIWQKLLPLATVATPNIPEAETLSGMEVHSDADMEQAARRIAEQYGTAVLCKGGHRTHSADDVLFSGGRCIWFRGDRIHNPNTHGTGCTLSSAIASYLAKGCTLEESVRLGKEYLSGALQAMLDLGKGSGPMNHMYCLESALCRSGNNRNGGAF